MSQGNALAFALLVPVLTLGVAEAGPITIIEPTDVQTEAREFTPTYPIVVDESTSFGFRTFEAAEGGASSRHHVNWIETATGALFDFDFEHRRTGDRHSFAESSAFISLLVSVDTPYSLSGRYSVTDFGVPGLVASYVRLHDLTPGSVGPFGEDSVSLNTPNEYFEVGVPGDADDTNALSGDLTGILLAGHHYEFSFNNYIYAETTSQAGARASGCVTLALGGATGAGACGITATQPVPEPNALALLGAGLAVLGVGVLRRRAVDSRRNGRPEPRRGRH